MSIDYENMVNKQNESELIKKSKLKSYNRTDRILVQLEYDNSKITVVQKDRNNRWERGITQCIKNTHPCSVNKFGSAVDGQKWKENQDPKY